MGTVGGKPTPEKAEELARDFDENCKRAAAAIKEAQFFLLCTGAGFSADSGLAVYKDIADVPAYHKMGLDYSALCVPDWIYDDPEIFYGFWGMCFNDYRKTHPHEGYHIVKRWKEKYFHPAASPAAERVHKKLEEAKNSRAERSKRKVVKKEEAKEEVEKEKEAKESVEEGEESKQKEESKEEEERESFSAANYDLPAAGPFFIYTSNVDAHSVKAGFSTNEVHEIHGNTETWQCSKPCTPSLWRPPHDFMFDINKETMRAPSTLPPYSAGDWKKHNGFIDNHPRCMNCGAFARPCILMFGDGHWESDDEQASMYHDWQRVVERFLEKEESAKMVIVEIGAGIRVPSVRFHSQNWLTSVPKGRATLVRINPDFPLNPETGEHTISLQTNGLTALRRINEFIEELEEKEKEK